MDLLNIYKLMKEKNIVFSFKGALSQEILVEMGNQLKSHLGLSNKLKKIFSVFIELAQNIMHYSDEREFIAGSEKGVGIVLFTETDEYFKVISGNLVENSKVDFLKNRLEYLKSLPNNELKNLYSEQIRNRRESNSKGAGLGFIEICRKSDSNIDYKFYPFNENLYFFSLVVIISKDVQNG